MHVLYYTAKLYIRPALQQLLPGAVEPPDLAHAPLAEAFRVHHLASFALVESALRESPPDAIQKLGTLELGLTELGPCSRNLTKLSICQSILFYPMCI